MTQVWEEQVVIPTYEIGQPEKLPMFLENRVYQGSSGVVYPYPVIEKLSDVPVDKTYNALYMENDYIKVMILPELGGRVQMAYDKIKRRHFVYYNHVIKPALVGLAGPWISGGIEFNWPQHHRPSTFMPVDHQIEHHDDGSVTVWINETERMFHQRSRVAFTLRPGCAYLEIRGHLYNGTDLPQTFLWWANPAVAVNEAYQSVFPQDVYAVYDHGKRAVSSFPIATGTYYKMDYSAGVDISNYKNIKVPTSYMAVPSKYNFVGGYENDTKAGMLHVADHHFSPGKKQWTWGNGDFGQAWDRNLTDHDGPYIELMAGVFTENQPDFAWLQPNEEKELTQYFMPYRELGVVKNASRDLLMNIEDTDDHKVKLQLLSTSVQEVHISLTAPGGRSVLELDARLTPETVFCRELNDAGVTSRELKLRVTSPSGRLLLAWEAEPQTVRPVPPSAKAALRPAEIRTNEQLYLTGLHLEQYRHARWNAKDYYEEALRRDPRDARNNQALGQWYLRRGRFEKAETYLRTAVEVLTTYNPNPYDGEAIYDLGVALKYQHRYDAAYDMMYKATWNGAWQDAAFLACARLSALQHRWEDALHEVEMSLRRNTRSHKAWALKVAVLRHLGLADEAERVAGEVLEEDHFNYGCLFEQYLAAPSAGKEEALVALMRQEAHNYEELAIDLMDCGLWEETLQLVALAARHEIHSPMLYYIQAYAEQASGREAGATLAAAQHVEGGICFPNRLWDITLLAHAMEHNPQDAHAPYYLGCLYYDKRQYDVAEQCWGKALKVNGQDSATLRNLALIHYNKHHDGEKAMALMERAFDADEHDDRMLFELDQLRKQMGYGEQERLEQLDRYRDLVANRDTLLLEYVTLLNQTRQYEQALTQISGHHFHPWEGGEGKVAAQYQFALTEQAKVLMGQKRYDEALSLLRACLCYPENLGEGKLYGAQENDFYYLMGKAYEALRQHDQARECWQKATLGPTEPAAAFYYNDAKSDKIFYQGAAWRALGDEKAARSTFHRLVNYGEAHLGEQVEMDYFAVSLPDLQIWEGDLQLINRKHCLYMLALGYTGLHLADRAAWALSQLRELEPAHQGAMALESVRGYIV